MTAQIEETIFVDGIPVALLTNPLDAFLERFPDGPRFESTSTALWRGYIGKWELTNSRLYLIELSGLLTTGSEASLETIFPGYPDRVFAHWYTGTLRIPKGRQIKYVHMGYGSEFEIDHFIRIERGEAVTSWVRENGTAPDGAPDYYGPAAMLVPPKPLR